jgi:serine/threonine protein kinase
MTEVLQSSTKIYIVLELITGGELFDRIVQAKRFSEDVARKFFQQLISGLWYCHSQGIAHRDLKPENLLLDDTDRLKISDFGLSALSSSSDGMQKMLMTTCGTPNYVAPEVLQEKGYSGLAADVWSCGVILYVMLAGYLPFEDDSMNGLFAKIERGTYSCPHHFSVGAKNLITRMMVVDPNKRIRVEQILEDEWFKKNFVPPKLMQNVKITDDLVKGAVMDANENQDGTDSKSSTPTTNTKTQMNAFDLLSTLMSGKMASLVDKTAPIRRETRFLAHGTASKVLQSLSAILKEMRADPIEKHGELKCVVAGSSAFTFSVTVQETSGGFCLVEVRRNRGAILDFNSFFRKFVSGCGSLVVSKQE